MVSRLRKWVSVMLIVVIVLNMVLFGFSIVSASVFWGVIGVAAVLAYVVLPRIKK